MFCWMDTEFFGEIVHFVFVFDEIGFCFRLGIGFDYKEMPVGGAALDLTGVPLPDETLLAAKESDAILFGAIGG